MRHSSEVGFSRPLVAQLHRDPAATPELQMLRIMIDEAPTAVTLRLEGKLIGPWVEEVEQCWQKAFLNLGHRTMMVDLSAVSFVDSAGQSLLERMHLAGFRLAGGELMVNFPA